MVLARKWRPAQFADIVGQGPVVRTLMNAIRTDRIHQAYLFTGSRGIGKTSIARIVAKVIRCGQNQWDGQWLKCCDTCSSCTEIARGNSVDVIEIDGASNNGVDHVREIRENARFMPSSGSRKLYIIDEVHMLSTAAFNALLKTLEEPPPHVIFLFATTEPHKIPATILSRVQRFDLRRVSTPQIQARLTQVLESEGLSAEAGALALVSRAAEGGLRDALSLLDQVIAFSGDRITLASIRESLGLIESQVVMGVLGAVLERNSRRALELVHDAFQQGHDLKLLARHLVEFLHGVILAKVGSSAEHAGEYSESEWTEIRKLAALRELEELELIFQALHHGIEWIARSPQPRTVLDVLLIKCAAAEALVVTGGGAAGGTTPAASVPKQAPKTSAPGNWEALTALIKSSRPYLGTALENGQCVRYPGEGDSSLVIRFAPAASFYKEQLQHRTQGDALNQILRETFGRFIQVQLEVTSEPDASALGESIASRRERELREREESTRLAARNHPVIVEAQALFGGELGPIEVVGGGGHARKP